ncbi:MAG: acetate uptake transporter [Solirubrobacteraceae bacterium]
MEASGAGPGGPEIAPHEAHTMAEPMRGRVWWAPADPVPVGIAGFALTTFILGLVNANAISGSGVYVVLSVAGAYGGMVQLLAGLWAFAERNTFAAAAFCSYGGFWISFVLLVQFFLPEAAKAGGPLAANHALALYLFCWGFFTFYMWFATFRLNVALNLVFLTLWVAYLLLGLGLLGGGHPTLTHWGGYVTTACAVLAWYVGAAHVLNATLGRTVLPLFPLGVRTAQA